MLKEYIHFITNALGSKDYLNIDIVNELVNNVVEIKEGLYISKTAIDEKSYRVLISIIDNEIIIYSSLTREYVTNSFDGFIKEIYVNEENNCFVKKEGGIYEYSKAWNLAAIISEFSSNKELKEEYKKECFYAGIENFNDISFYNNKKIKTKNLI